MLHAVLTAGYKTSHKKLFLHYLMNLQKVQELYESLRVSTMASMEYNVCTVKLYAHICIEPKQKDEHKTSLFRCFLTATGERRITHHFHSTEDMTEMVATLQILGNISKSAEVIWVLSSARNVPDLMLRNYSLMDRGRKEVLTDGGWENQLQSLRWTDQYTCTDTHSHTFPLPLWLHQWTWPLYR